MQQNPNLLVCMFMSHYPKRVRANILPLSDGDSLPEAFEEWSFTEKTRDHEEPVETCRLCDKKKVRYHFEIENVITGKTLWVGSHCILQFGLSVFDNGRKLSPEDAKKKLVRMTNHMRLEACLKSLQELAHKDGRDQGMLQNALEYYRKNKFLTPKYAFVVLWRLKERGIDHSPSFFKVALKRADHKQHLLQMTAHKLSYIWPALSSSQRKLAVQLGQTPPSP